MTNTKKRFSGFFKTLMIALPVAIGVAAFVIMSQSKKPPKQKSMKQITPTVRVMSITPMDVVPRATGYGTANPIQTWKAVAQVSGKIIYAHPQLQKGSIVKQGVELLKIDPTEYRINLNKSRANIQSFKIQIGQKKVEQKNYLALLNLQQTDLQIKQKEVERQKGLYDKKIISKAEYESQFQSLISQEVQIQNIRNSLNLIPVQTELLQTQLEQAQGDLESAKLKLSYTIISAPFDMQIGFINNKLSEHVQTGQTILEANDISESEVEAQFVMKSMMPIFLSVKDKAGEIGFETKSIGDVLGIRAKVRLAGTETGWDGSFDRRSDSLDTDTRTIGMIVSVKNNPKMEGPRRGKLLLKGAYCEVELIGQVQKNKLVIPRSALHPGDTVLLVDADKKLVKKQVEILYTLSDFAVIKSGLKKGDVLILSDLTPAVTGMKIDPVQDKKLMAKLSADAKGEAP
jgi:multidrug efflux pump subunit AcrA (membrane-fusion protein)